MYGRDSCSSICFAYNFFCVNETFFNENQHKILRFLILILNIFNNKKYLPVLALFANFKAKSG